MSKDHITEKCRECGAMVASNNQPGLGRNQRMAFFACRVCGSKWQHLIGPGKSDTELDRMRQAMFARWNKMGLFSSSPQIKKMVADARTIDRISKQLARVHKKSQ